MRHDWVYRWEAVLKTVGLEPMQGVLERKERLRKLAEVVLQNGRDNHVRVLFFGDQSAGRCSQRYLLK